MEFVSRKRVVRSALWTVLLVAGCGGTSASDAPLASTNVAGQSTAGTLAPGQTVGVNPVAPPSTAVAGGSPSGSAVNSSANGEADSSPADMFAGTAANGQAAVEANPPNTAMAGAQGPDNVSDSGVTATPTDGMGDGMDTTAKPTGPSTLPGAADLKAKGPFTAKQTAGPAGYVLFYPQELGEDGVLHPILAWGPGAVENASMFITMLSHFASHGFAVISYDATPAGPELTEAIDWMVAENGREGSDFYRKLDTTKIAAGGHSAGSLATFSIGADERLTTTLHISGGTFSPHTDIENLHAPTLFICGESAGDGLIVGDVARANCDIDFDNAKVPVFYGVTKGASHMTPTEVGDPTLRTYQLEAMTAWMRWQLAGETGASEFFIGDGCTLCADSNWTVKQRDLQ